MRYVTPAMKHIEQERGKPIAAVLAELFDQYGSQVAVANELGINQGTLSMWLLRLGLKQHTVLVEREEKAS